MLPRTFLPPRNLLYAKTLPDAMACPYCESHHLDPKPALRHAGFIIALPRTPLTSRLARDTLPRMSGIPGHTRGTEANPVTSPARTLKEGAATIS